VDFQDAAVIAFSLLLLSIAHFEAARLTFAIYDSAPVLADLSPRQRSEDLSLGLFPAA
jgi:hypothetical protein